MTRDLHEVLTEAARTPREEADVDALWRRGRRRRQRKQLGAGLAGLVVLAVLAGVVAGGDVRFLPAPAPIADTPPPDDPGDVERPTEPTEDGDRVEPADEDAAIGSMPEWTHQSFDLDPVELPPGTPPLAAVEGDGSVIRIGSADDRRFLARTAYREVGFDDEGRLHAARLEDGDLVIEVIEDLDAVEAIAVEVLRVPHAGVDDEQRDDRSGTGYLSSFAVALGGVAVVHQEAVGGELRRRVELLGVANAPDRSWPIPEATRPEDDPDQPEVALARAGFRTVLVQLDLAEGGGVVAILDLVEGNTDVAPDDPTCCPDLIFEPSAGGRVAMADGARAAGPGSGDAADRVLLAEWQGAELARVEAPAGGGLAAPVAVTAERTVAHLVCADAAACRERSYTLVLRTHPDGATHPLLTVEDPIALAFAPSPP